MKRIILLVLLLLLTVGCQSDQVMPDERMAELEEQIRVMESERVVLIDKIEIQNHKIEELQKQVDRMIEVSDARKIQDDLYPGLSNLAHQFVRAHTTGDLEKVRALLDPKISVELSDGEMRAFWNEGDVQMDWVLWQENAVIIYRDKVIQGYGQLEDGTMLIHIREFYESGYEEVSPPTFLNLYFQQVDDEWKISYFEFDV